MGEIPMRQYSCKIKKKKKKKKLQLGISATAIPVCSSAVSQRDMIVRSVVADVRRHVTQGRKAQMVGKTGVVEDPVL